VAWGAICGIVAILSFWNMINLIVDWLAPVYVALWLWPPCQRGTADTVLTGRNTVDHRAYRLNLVVQFLVLGFFVALFFIQFLPYIIISLQEFGIPAHGLVFFPRSMDVLRYLFPNPIWGIVALAGVVGWYFMWRNPGTRHLGAVCILSVVVS